MITAILPNVCFYRKPKNGKHFMCGWQQLLMGLYALSLPVVFVCINVVCAALCFGGALSPACHPMMLLMLPAAAGQKHTTDDIVSSAECSSDDEDLEECETGHAGGLG